MSITDKAILGIIARRERTDRLGVTIRELARALKVYPNAAFYRMRRLINEGMVDELPDSRGYVLSAAYRKAKQDD